MHKNQNSDTVELTSDEVRTMTVETLMNHMNLVVDGHKYKTEDIWNVTVAASAQGQAIQSAANQLENAPDPRDQERRAGKGERGSDAVWSIKG